MAQPANAAALAAYTEADVRAFTPGEITSFFTANPASVMSFPVQHAKLLNPMQIQAFPTAVMTALTPQFTDELTAVQVGSLLPVQLGALTSMQVSSLKRDQVIGLTQGQLSGLSAPQLRTLMSAIQPANIGALVHAMTPAAMGAVISALPAPSRLALISTMQPAQVTELIVSVNPTDIPALIPAFTAAPEKIVGLTRVQLAAVVAPADIAALMVPAIIAEFAPEQIPYLTNAQIVAMTLPTQIHALDSVKHIPKLTTTQIHALTPAQVVNFSPLQIKALDAYTQIPELSGPLVAALPVPLLQSLTPAQMKALAIQHVNILALPAITNPDLIQSLDTSKLTGPQVGVLTTTQVRILTPVQVQAMLPSQLGSLGIPQVQALSSEQLSGLTDAQRTVLIPNLTPAQINSMGKAPTAEQVAKAEKTRAEAGLLNAQANEAQHQTTRKDNQAAADIKQQDALTGLTNTEFINSLLERNNPMAMAAFQEIVDRPQPPSPEMVQNITSTVASAMKGADPVAVGEAITAALLAVNRPYIESLSHKDNQLNAILEDRAAERAHQKEMAQEARLGAHEARVGAHNSVWQTTKNTNLATVLGTMTAANMSNLQVKAARDIANNLIQH